MIRIIKTDVHLEKMGILNDLMMVPIKIITKLNNKKYAFVISPKGDEVLLSPSDYEVIGINPMKNNYSIPVEDHSINL